MTSTRKLFAVVPAAGWSRRMGEPKLLMQLGTRTVMGRLLDSLDRDGISERIVVMRNGDDALLEEVSKTNATVVRPEVDPPDMRSSVQAALDEIHRRCDPSADDGWLLQPADHPVLDPAVIDQLLARWQHGGNTILVPTHAGRRGHPTLFRWSLAAQVARIPPNCGLNWLVDRYRDETAELAVESDSVLCDLDTPADWQRLQERWNDENQP